MSNGWLVDCLWIHLKSVYYVQMWLDYVRFNKWSMYVLVHRSMEEEAGC